MSSKQNEEEVTQVPNSEVLDMFWKCLKEDKDLPLPVASIRALTQVIKGSLASTMTELTMEIEHATKLLRENTKNSIPVSAGCELFLRFVTRTALDVTDFDESKRRLIERGEGFSLIAMQSKEKIGQFGAEFIRDGATILTHSFSRLVMKVLLEAAKQNKRFKLYVTDSRPTRSGFIFIFYF